MKIYSSSGSSGQQELKCDCVRLHTILIFYHFQECSLELTTEKGDRGLKESTGEKWAGHSNRIINIMLLNFLFNLLLF